MKSRMLISTLLLMFIIAANTSAQDQDEKVEQAINKAIRAMPTESANPRDFIPKDWRSDGIESGDLNGDDLTDCVLNLTLDDDAREEILRDKESGIMLTAPNIVVVLLADDKGKLRRLAVNGRLKPTYETYSMFTVKIDKNVLSIIEDYSFTHEANAVTFRYRYDPAMKKMMLIGFDFEYYSRDKSNNSVKTSENYLTGERIITVKEAERRKNREYYYARTKTSREKFNPAKVAFEDTFLNREGGLIEVRPF